MISTSFPRQLQLHRSLRKGAQPEDDEEEDEEGNDLMLLGRQKRRGRKVHKPIWSSYFQEEASNSEYQWHCLSN